MATIWGDLCLPRPDLDPKLGPQPVDRLAVDKAALDAEKIPEVAANPILVVVPGSCFGSGDLDGDAAVGAKTKLIAG